MHTKIDVRIKGQAYKVCLGRHYFEHRRHMASHPALKHLLICFTLEYTEMLCI